MRTPEHDCFWQVERGIGLGRHAQCIGRAGVVAQLPLRASTKLCKKVPYRCCCVRVGEVVS